MQNIGHRKYELSNHLGNVLSIVSDKIISRDEDNDDVVDEYWADILQSTDYSPFGVALYNRKFEKTVETCHDDTDTVTTTIMNEDFTAGGSWTKLSLTGTGLSYGSGEMINVKSSTTAPALAVGAYKDFTVSTGGHYSVSMDLTSNTCGYPVSLSIKNSGGTVIANVSCTATGTHTLAFNLPGSGTYRVEIRRSVNTICNFHVDNVIVVHHEITTTTTCENTPPWYRYAFNGMEKDDELKGKWNSYTTFYRMLDPRIGRWFSIDPRVASIPWQSPYCSMDNTPILFNDVLGDKVKPDGTEEENKTFKDNLNGSSKYVTFSIENGELKYQFKSITETDANNIQTTRQYTMEDVKKDSDAQLDLFYIRAIDSPELVGANIAGSDKVGFMSSGFNNMDINEVNLLRGNEYVDKLKKSVLLAFGSELNKSAMQMEHDSEQDPDKKLSLFTQLSSWNSSVDFKNSLLREFKNEGLKLNSNSNGAQVFVQLTMTKHGGYYIFGTKDLPGEYKATGLRIQVKWPTVRGEGAKRGRITSIDPDSIEILE